MAVIPWTPAAANAFRSAWIPAPPPESEPAIASTRGVRAPSVTPRSMPDRRPFVGPDAGTADEPARFQRAEQDAHPAGVDLGIRCDRARIEPALDGIKDDGLV